MLGVEAIVIWNDRVKRAGGIAEGADNALLAKRLMSSPPPRRAASLLVTATVLIATSVSAAQAEYVEPGPSVHLAQATTSDPGGSQGAPEQESHRAEVLVRGLAAARSDLESVLSLLRKARDESARIKGASENEDVELREALQQERELVGRLEQELAAARRDVETQAVKNGLAELRKSLRQERERAGWLAHALAGARRDVETQAVLAAKAAEETARDKQVAEGTAELRRSLSQQRERADRLEQVLAAAQRDVEVQTTLAAKAREDAARQAGRKE